MFSLVKGVNVGYGRLHMAIFIKVSNPQDLLSDIKRSINEGYIKEWSCDRDGDLTSTKEEIQNEAWFHPYTSIDNFLVSGIVGRKNVNISKALFSIYHSLFVNTLLANYSSQLDGIMIKPPFSNSFDTQNVE